MGLPYANDIGPGSVGNSGNGLGEGGPTECQGPHRLDCHRSYDGVEVAAGESTN